MMKKTYSAALLLGALLAVPAWAGGERPIDERRPLKADARVSVENVAGLVEVEAWDRNELHLTGTLAADVEELAISGSESKLRIEVRLPKASRKVGPTTLRLKVPAGVAFEANAVSADVRVRGLRGALDVDSVSGDVTIDAESKRIEVGTVSGDVTVRAPAEDTRVASVSGDVSVHGVRGDVRGKSVSGDVQLSGGALRRLELETVSGDLDIDAELAADCEVSAQTLSGHVRLTLPRLPDGRLDMKTFSGDLTSAFAPSVRGKEFRHEGKGRASVKLSSFSGDIELKKK
jgi:DUF4097 and DUF4098 domain-containing protein YvlB